LRLFLEISFFHRFLLLLNHFFCYPWAQTLSERHAASRELLIAAEKDKELLATARKDAASKQDLLCQAEKEAVRNREMLLKAENNAASKEQLLAQHCTLVQALQAAVHEHEVRKLARYD